MGAANGGTGNLTQGGLGGKGRKREPSEKREWVITGVAIVVLFLYGVLMLWALNHFNLEEKEWSRLTWVVKGVEAIVFAAGGFLFGRQVNRERAEKAEKRADAKTEDSKHEHAAAMAFKERLKSIAGTARQGTAEALTDSPQSAHLRAIAAIAQMEDPSGWPVVSRVT